MINDLFQLGDPRSYRGIVIVPLFPRCDPVASYTTLDDALAGGLVISEVSSAGSVPELLVENPLAENVLLYDGEELIGAKQNRILNVSVLVAAGAGVSIPVSCVEEGRWSSRSAQFASAEHVSHTHLRRRKAEMLATRPLARGVAQGEVWDEVRAKASRMRVDSPTHANRDTFDAHRDSLAALERAFPLEPGQCGAVLGLTDALCLDWVSRPEAFVQLWPKLRRGYLLDALEYLDGSTTSRERIDKFVRATVGAPPTRQPSAGLGDDLRLRGAGVIGSGLELSTELIQLSAFTSDQNGATGVGRIARPSRRR